MPVTQAKFGIWTIWVQKCYIQRHEILCLKSVVWLGALNDFIGSEPGIYDNTGCDYILKFENFRVGIDYVFA